MMDRTYAVVDLDAAAHNMKEIRSHVQRPTQIMAVVKADAYGHGAIPISRVFLENGADRLAVAFAGEGIQLRRAGITAPIVLFGATLPEFADRLTEYDLIPAVFDIESARAISDAAVRQGKKQKIHIKLDTGMSRIGFFCNTNKENDEVIRAILEIASLPMLEIEGMFTHFSTADEADDSYTKRQFSLFCEIADGLERQGLHIPLKHVCNSAATWLYPEMHLDMVRPGIIQYGMPPSDFLKGKQLPLKPVMSLKSRVTCVKEIPANTCIGYGNTFCSQEPMRIATVPVGYADGYFRCLSGRAGMTVNGTFCPVVGRICMDQCMIDVTTVNNIRVGDEVTVFGAEPSAYELAKQGDTISYELLCAVGKRVPRVYQKEGRVIAVSDPFAG